MAPSRHTARDARQPGWFYLDDALIDRHGETVGAIGIAVYAALARHAKTNGHATVSYGQLEKSLCVVRNTIKAALDRLEAAGLITITPQTDEAGNPIAANIYTLCVIPEQKREKAHRGVSADDTGGSLNDTPPSANDQGGSIDDRGGSLNAYIGHDSFSYQSDLDPPPPPNPPAPDGGGGGGRSEDPTEVQKLLIRFGFSATAAKRFRDLPIDAVQAELKAARARGSGPGSLVEAWKVAPPTAPPKPTTRSPEPPRISYPDDVLTPQQAAEALARLRKKQQEATHDTS